MAQHTGTRGTQPISLRDAVSQLMEQAFTMPGFATPAAVTGYERGVVRAPCNVFEDDQNYYVFCLLPGVRPEDIDVTSQEGLLSITGKIQPMVKEGATPLLQEIMQCVYHRELHLPVNFEAEKAQATFNDGVLFLSLPKAEEAKPRRLAIQPGKAKSGTAGKDH